MPEAIQHADDVQHAGDGRVQRADLIGMAERFSVARVFIRKHGAAHGGFALIFDLEPVLMDAIDDESHGADTGLADEPPEVFLAVHGVDAADEESAKEEAHHAAENARGSLGFAQGEVAKSGQDVGENRREGFELFVVPGDWHGAVASRVGGVMLRGVKKSRGLGIDRWLRVISVPRVLGHRAAAVHRDDRAAFINSPVFTRESVMTICTSESTELLDATTENIWVTPGVVGLFEDDDDEEAEDDDFFDDDEDDDDFFDDEEEDFLDDDDDEDDDELEVADDEEVEEY